MCHKKWDERMNEKKWDEMQKYKEFNKENFKGIEKFSKIFNKIFNFFRFSFLGICIIVIVIVLLIYLAFTSDLKEMYVSSFCYSNMYTTQSI